MTNTYDRPARPANGGVETGYPLIRSAEGDPLAPQ
jgi:hypothetical protein